jgi:2-polyprenyl-6-methoxyphenol hydroxylase-like FAD-dependent oxidoreductase
MQFRNTFVRLLFVAPLCHPISVLAMATPNGGIEKLDIAIVGGGPSGLSVALALLRGAPLATSNIALFESDSFQPKGASIVMSRSGWDALRCIDPVVCRRAQRNGAPVSALLFKDFSGNPKLPRPVRWLVWSLYPFLRALGLGIVKGNGWHDLRDVLRNGVVEASLPLGYSTGSDGHQDDKKKLIRAGEKLLEIDTSSQEGRVLLTFDGGKQVSASLVIACDGAFSKVRECLDKIKTASLPTEPFLLDQHKTVWRGTAPTVDAKNIATFYVASPQGSGEGESATCCIFPAGRTTPGSSISIIMASVPGRASSSDDARKRLDSALAKLGVPIDDLVRRTIDGVDHMLEHRLHTRNFDAYPSLESGEERIGFLGDSAHPLRPTGEGIGIAMEDAWTIGKLAKEAVRKDQENGLPVSGDIFTPDMLRQYEVERQDRVTAICAAVQELAESYYDNDDGKKKEVQTKKTGVNKAMKEFPIYLEPLG